MEMGLAHGWRSRVGRVGRRRGKVWSGAPVAGLLSRRGGEGYASLLVGVAREARKKNGLCGNPFLCRSMDYMGASTAANKRMDSRHK